MRLSKFVGPTSFIGLLTASLLLGSWATYRHTQHVPEYPFGCDSFGYLRMARQIRHEHGSPWTADYHLQHDQTKRLAHACKEAGIPADHWHELVAPHAHHYFARRDAVGPQYPPGTGLFLAAFPEGRAVAGLNVAANICLTSLGLAMMLWAARLEAWLAAASISLATLFSLRLLAEIGVSSFSINAMLVPVLVSILCSHFSSWSADGSWRRPFFAFMAGAFLGLAILIRMPILFIAPGLAILLLPRMWRLTWRSAIIREPLPMFLIGLICFGVLQVMWHQHRVAGAWNQPTYGLNDTAPPLLKYLPDHALFYLRQPGTGAIGHGLILILALLLLTSLRFCQDRTRHRRVVLSILVTWVIPLAYFLTHRVTTHYYLLPSTFATIWMLALSLIGRWRDSQPRMDKSSRRFHGIASGCVAALGLILAVHLYIDAPDSPAPDSNRPQIPSEFHQDQPWIWADMTSGTIVYYGDVPTFKVTFSNRETRHFVYTFAFTTGKPQFLVLDCPSMEDNAAEIRSMGGILELRGEVAWFPYYLIHWPPGGPVLVPKS